MIVDSVKLNFYTEGSYNYALGVLDKLYPNGDIDANMVKDKYIGKYWEVRINESMTPDKLNNLLQLIDEYLDE